MDTEPDSTAFKFSVSFKYFRVFPSSKLPHKGKPSDYHLYSYQRGQEAWRPYERGGKALCQIVRSCKIADGFTYTDKVLAEGEAICSMSDIFDYGVARQKAFKRAVVNYLKSIGYQDVIYTFASAIDRWGRAFWLTRDALYAFEELRQDDPIAAHKFDFDQWNQSSL